MGISRREVITQSGLITGSLVVAGIVSAAPSTCTPTPAQTEGPFYPVTPQSDTDADLTFVMDREKSALGDPVLVEGRVLGIDCLPISNALVEIWQACASGKYDHPEDPNTAELDPNFQYWGRILTDSDGKYKFKTIIPGSYPASESWIRPPHIHFKVSAPRRRTFVTQMYFAGNDLNEKDLILQRLSSEQQKLVIIEPTIGEMIPIYNFEITLNTNGDVKLTPEID